MHFFILSLSHLATICLAADNSSKQQIQNPDSSASNCPQKDVELETLSMLLQMFVDFDQNYFTNLNSKRMSIESASQMSFSELNDLESISEASLAKAQDINCYYEEHVHSANSSLAKLFKQKESLKSHQVTFDAWKDSGLSAVKFMGMEISVACEEERYENAQKKLSTHMMITFDLKSAAYSKKPMKVYRAYQK